jgi:hypothetical protein
VRVKAHEVPIVGGSTIHLMLGKVLEKEWMGGYGMLCDVGVGWIWAKGSYQLGKFSQVP